MTVVKITTIKYKRKEKQMKKSYLTAQELAPIVGLSVPASYARIRQMNDELREKGYQTVQGKISIKYAKEKFYGIDFEEVEEVEKNAEQKNDR